MFCFCNWNTFIRFLNTEIIIRDNLYSSEGITFISLCGIKVILLTVKIILIPRFGMLYVATTLSLKWYNLPTNCFYSAASLRLTPLLVVVLLGWIGACTTPFIASRFLLSSHSYSSFLRSECWCWYWYVDGSGFCTHLVY